MRKAMWLLAPIFAAATAAPATAQSNPFGGPSGPLQYNVVATYDTTKPIASPQTVNVPSNPQRFFNSSPGRITNQQAIGRSNFPTDQQLPGDDYLKAFRVKRYARTSNPWWWLPWNWF